MAQDDLDHIPSIVPGRDDDDDPVPHSRTRRAETSRGSGRGKDGGSRGNSGGGGGGSRLVALVAVLALVGAAGAGAWAWQLQKELGQTTVMMDRYAKRIVSLEDRLSDTDEGLSQNTEAMAVKIKELYSEVDKLWASAWRRNRAAIEELQQSSSAQGNKLAAANKSLEATSGQLEEAMADLSRLKSVAGDMERLTSNARSNQAAVEQATDRLNRLNADLTRLAKRVESNEEWVQSINAFRGQVNRSLSELQATVRDLRAAP